MRILIVNDDGFHAEGIARLTKVAAKLTDDVWVVAPEQDQSGVAHALSLHQPMRLRQMDSKRFVVTGTPTDCVLMAIHHLMDKPPDLVLSGINLGHNLAEDVHYSGTVAGALEAACMGIPAIALSQVCDYNKPEDIYWRTGEEYAARVITSLYDSEMLMGAIINVNFPDCPPGEVAGIKATTQGMRDQSMAYIDRRFDNRRLAYYWLGFKKGSHSNDNGNRDSDINAVNDNYISVTPLKVDMTCHDRMLKLTSTIEGILNTKDL